MITTSISETTIKLGKPSLIYIREIKKYKLTEQRTSDVIKMVSNTQFA